MASIHHTSINVSNLEKSQQFYQSLFDLEFHNSFDRPEENLKGIILKDNKNNLIELLFTTNGSSESQVSDHLHQIGIKHLAFLVDDIETIFAEAQSLGAKVIWPIKDGITVKKIAFISDPDGIPIELLEPK